MNTGSAVILAFDFGLKRIGCAIGNDLSKSARPLTYAQMGRRMICTP